ncbi:MULTISPECIES: ABC transporter ATP-binding protein [Virgibacillus]|uniref:Peptide ABC transporter ATP-binding protein n=1 Tax=Virgibacillus pantothenticus TaxID=1473 RepID=A0A0L0QLU7_VIRPA|nr:MULTISPECIES: ABC transporter ATP-binding protein [Virgibacillus]API93287.1 peptide ABC transporter ATP-binding protein [Virgibacillus sp. 6R]KNE19562.1 peptide ABC transporter ATP-binding protein [Virgibacillus pantothenticus]MEB5451395.1 ABC transporter ATP-binding protein [Virgibacillus pantothenticus]MEB5455421.1 ABC transporter ATP-binding protein [Virgibacillus pantothenticus]MEB5459573.1 ABC transporter ATP-binding protein [Virgibacillus pantothenticus]
MTAPLLSVQEIDVAFQLPAGEFPALENISFHVYPNEVVGIVGESGCGKSLTSQAIMGILPKAASIKHGNISFQDCSLNHLSSREWQELRGNELTMIFQEPMTSLNPVLTIGRQIAEVLKKHTSLSKIERKQQVIKTMKEVGLPRAEALWKAYPHQLSGGMRQRVAIAMALIGQPKLIIADEPTTALDVTIQSQILDLFHTIKQNHNTSLLFISHDWGVIHAICDRVLVMYAGRIVEQGDVEKLISEPKHPYTQSLIQSIPDATKRGQRLYTIPGTVPRLQERQAGCPFSDRCTYKIKQCETLFPDTYEFDGHTVACHLFAKEGDRN